MIWRLVDMDHTILNVGMKWIDRRCLCICNAVAVVVVIFYMSSFNWYFVWMILYQITSGYIDTYIKIGLKEKVQCWMIDVKHLKIFEKFFTHWLPWKQNTQIIQIISVCVCVCACASCCRFFAWFQICKPCFNTSY